MGTLSWIIFAVVLVVVYLSNFLIDGLIRKKWKLKISFSSFLFLCLAALFFVYLSDNSVSDYVAKNVPHEWKEEILSVQVVEDVSRSREQEGSFFLGIGDTHERETFRYTIVREDGTRVREKLYTSDCSILKVDKKQKVVYVRNVRVYKNPADRKFFHNSHDATNGFYKVYIL